MEWRSDYLSFTSLLDSFNVDLPMIKWEDNKPWLIEDLKKLEVVEEYEADKMTVKELKGYDINKIDVITAEEDKIYICF